jgi:hypothetical protein
LGQETAFERDLQVGMPGVSTTLVSSDGVKFHVPTVLLAMASPFFSDLLQSKKNSSIPAVVTMSGVSAAALDTILRYLYPITPKPSLKDVAEAASLVQIARKYQFAVVENNILADVAILLDAEPNPLRAWVGAIACGADVARKAAMIRFLKVDDEDFWSVQKEARSALTQVTAQQLYDLQMWRATAVKQAKRAIETVKVEHCEFSHQTTFVRLITGNIGNVNPFVLFDTFFPILAQAKGPAQSVNGQFVPGPQARQIIIKALRAEVQEVLTTSKCKSLIVPVFNASLSCRLNDIALKHANLT